MRPAATLTHRRKTDCDADPTSCLHHPCGSRVSSSPAKRPKGSAERHAAAGSGCARGAANASEAGINPADLADFNHSAARSPSGKPGRGAEHGAGIDGARTGRRGPRTASAAGNEHASRCSGDNSVNLPSLLNGHPARHRQSRPGQRHHGCCDAGTQAAGSFGHWPEPQRDCAGPCAWRRGFGRPHRRGEP